MSNQEKHVTLAPLYQQFTFNIVALLLTIVVTVGFTLVLFYQNNSQNSALVNAQLIPLGQELKKIKTLQKADKLIDSLLVAKNAENFVELHAKLISANQKLLQTNLNGQLFQQWLNESKLAEDIVLRIQSSYPRNEQLKQTSIIQLQLMLFSITAMVDNQLAAQQLLDKQLKIDQAKGKVTYGRVNTFAKSVQQSNNLQQLKLILDEVLLGFEQLNIHTPILSFDRLRLKVEQAFIQYKQLANDEKVEAFIDLQQQFDTFKKIVLTEQRALAKWQGYIRLAQDYQFDLQQQQQQINELLVAPYQANTVNKTGVINELLGKSLGTFFGKSLSQLNIELSNKNITTMLIVVISLCLLFFFYTLWQLRKKIKVSAKKSIDLIQRSIEKPETNVVANCFETQKVINHIHNIVKPPHHENELKVLSQELQDNELALAQLQQKVVQLTEDNQQQKLNYKAQISEQLIYELQCYQLLEKTALSISQQSQLLGFNQETSSSRNSQTIVRQLKALYLQLTQFHLVLETKLERSVLQYSDINLIDEIYAILFNKQQEQHINNNQLFIRCDEQLLSKVNIDYRLFHQLVSLFIDLSLSSFTASHLKLNLQLKDKNAGQQLVHFSATVKTQPCDTLPEVISTLVNTQTKDNSGSPLIKTFHRLFTKQHGLDLCAQLVDEGCRLSFDLPLAMTITVDKAEKVILENTEVLLLSNNEALTELIESIILSAKGKFEQLSRIDSVKQRISAPHLNRHKLDLLIVSSEIAFNHLGLITQLINDLPLSLKPKLMILQSKTLDFEHFGFYSQVEQVFCKETFLQNLIQQLASEALDNLLIPCEPFAANQYRMTELPLLLAVKSPQQHQNLYRLLQWLGLQVQVVSHEAAQKSLWSTGAYSLLITEFPETALLEMVTKPLVSVGVFSLTQVMPHSENNVNFEHWHIDKLATKSTLTELIEALSPWLKPLVDAKNNVINDISSDESSLVVDDLDDIDGLGDGDSDFDNLDDFIITEIADVFTENMSEAAFNVAQYIQHQGSVELALFMLDTYTQENHQQLDALIEAIKAKKLDTAKIAIAALALNAKILSAHELESLCLKWSSLFSGTETFSSVEAVNTLLKDTRVTLNEIDEFAETI